MHVEIYILESDNRWDDRSLHPSRGSSYHHLYKYTTYNYTIAGMTIAIQIIIMEPGFRSFQLTDCWTIKEIRGEEGQPRLEINSPGLWVGSSTYSANIDSHEEGQYPSYCNGHKFIWKHANQGLLQTP